MSTGEHLSRISRRVEPYLTTLTKAIVLKKIRRSEMIRVAEELEEAARELRLAIGAVKNDDTERSGAED